MGFIYFYSDARINRVLPHKTCYDPYCVFAGIFYELNMKDVALKVFRKGEQAFFQVLGHMLTLTR